MNFLIQQNGKIMLKNKKIFISGAYGHLGKSISETLAKNHADLIIHGRDATKLNKLSKYLKLKYNCKIKQAVFDLNDFDAVKKYFKSIKRLDVLINNAHSSKMGSINHISTDDFMQTLRNNVINVYNLINITKNILRKKISQDSSSIINISSIYSLVSPDLSIYSKKNENSISYGSSKSALNQMTKYFAISLSKHNIKVNNLILGPFPNIQFKKKYPATSKKILTKIPLSRFGNSKDLEGPIIFLCSNYSSYVTGSNLVVDGGWTVR